MAHLVSPLDYFMRGVDWGKSNEQKPEPPVVDPSSPYSILGIDPSATPAEIVQAWRRMAKNYHPDLNPSTPSSAQMFIRVKEAYELLGDPQKRRKYDAARKLLAKKSSAPDESITMWASGGKYNQPSSVSIRVQSSSINITGSWSPLSRPSRQNIMMSPASKMYKMALSGKILGWHGKDWKVIGFRDTTHGDVIVELEEIPAPSGTRNNPHIIDQNRVIRCGITHSLHTMKTEVEISLVGKYNSLVGSYAQITFRNKPIVGLVTRDLYDYAHDVTYLAIVENP